MMVDGVLCNDGGSMGDGVICNNESSMREGGSCVTMGVV